MIRVPAVSGVIARRILVNFRVQPDVLQAVLPAPFRPKLVHGFGMAGICLIRLAEVRPRFVPRALGLGSENAAHRVAVEWDTPSGTREGVYIPRRDTSSRLNVLVGGRLFPGEHRPAAFRILESETALEVSFRSHDGSASVAVRGQVATTLPPDSVFRSVDEASQFFAAGSLGCSATSRPGVFDGLELRSLSWSVEPFQVEEVESSFFSDRKRFPPEGAKFDCALLMRRIPHEWHAHPALVAEQRESRSASGST